MSSVDSRIVTMKFDNAAFQKGASTTLSTLDKLKLALTGLGSSKKGMNDLSAAASKFSLGNMGSQVEGVSKKFLALGTIGITALASITNKAIDSGLQLAKSLTIDPIKSGFDEYELKMGSIQTILANTTKYGTKLKDVNKALNQLNTYADKTIFNFGDMTRNIGLFTNAGIRLKDATAMIKGFSNEAASSGASAASAAGAAQQLSQALNSGVIRAQDWFSITNAGMGSANMRDGLIQIADAMGTFEGKSITAQAASKNFKGSLEKEWLTAGVMTNYLKIQAGDLNKEQIIGLGLSAKQATALLKQQKIAQDAATKVRTFSQLIGTLRESVGSGWSETFNILFGNFNQATKLFTSVNDSIGGMLTSWSNARNKVLKDWAKLGGRTVLIESIANIFKALVNVLSPIRDAFRDIFPATTGQRLYDLTVMFRDFTEKLIAGKGTMDNIHDVFKAIFGVLGVGWEIIKGVVHYFTSLFGLVAGGTGGFLDLAGSVSEIVANLADWIIKGDFIKKFFDTIIAGRAAVFGPIIAAISEVVSKLADLVTIGAGKAFDWLVTLKPYADAATKAISAFVDQVKELVASGMDKMGVKFSAGLASIGPLIAGLGGIIKDAFSSLGDFSLGSIFDIGDETSVAEAGIKNVGFALDGASKGADRVKAAFHAVMQFLSGIGSAMMDTFAKPLWDGISAAIDWIKSKFSGMDTGDALLGGLLALDAGLLVSWYVTIHKFFKGISDISKNFAGSIKSMGGMFDSVSSHLKTMQRDVKANIILKIAAALALLAVALLVLSTIDGKKLAMALGAVSVLLLELVVALKQLDEEGATLKSGARLALLSAALVGLGLAVLALSAAVAILGNMDTATLLKGIGSIAAIIGIIVGASAILEKGGGGTQMIAASIAIGILAVSLTAFAGAVKLFSTIDTGMLANGGLKIVALLAALGLVMKLMPKNILVTAAGLLILSSALVIMSGAMAAFGNFDAETMAKSLIMLGGSLLIISLGLNAMKKGGIAGAAAILLFAVALAALVPSLVILGSMSVENIVKSLLALVGVFAVLGLAALTIGPLVPIIIGLAGGIALLGVAALAVGAGLLMFSIGLATLAASGAAGAAVLTAAIISIGATIPLIMAQFGLGIIAFAKVIAKAGPALIQAFTTVLNALLQSVIDVTPKIGKVILTLLETGLNVIRAFVPRMIAAGISILMAFLTGVEKNIGQVVTRATNIVVNFLNALTDGVPKIARAGTNFMIALIQAIADEVPRLADAGAKAIIDLVNGIADAVDNNAEELGRAGGRLAGALISGMVRGMFAGVGQIADAAWSLGRSAIDSIANAIDSHSPSKEAEKLGRFVNEGFIKGLLGSRTRLENTLDRMNGLLKDSMHKAAVDVKSEQNKLDKLLKTHDDDSKAVKAAKKRLASAKAEAKAQANYALSLEHEGHVLLSLADSYDAVVENINKAKDALEDAIATRDNAAKDISGQFFILPDIEDDTTVEEYTNELKTEADKTRKLLDSLQQLVGMGLDDTSYQKLLDEGIGAQPFIDKLIAAGPDAVAAVNSATGFLANAAADLGKKASIELYQAGVDSANGLIKGLKDSKTKIENAMEDIANSMANTLRRALKIHSPSRVFDKIGKYSSQGLAQGLSSYSGVVKKSATDVGMAALDAIKATMAGLSDSISDDVNMSPVISPVLDLTRLKRDASQIGTMLNPKSMAAEVSYGQAMSISRDRQATQASSPSAVTESTTPVVKFEQNNYSPKALSAVDIYRQTKNQLSLAKEALNA